MPQRQTQTQVPPPGSAPAAMPPPPPGTGLTTGRTAERAPAAAAPGAGRAADPAPAGADAAAPRATDRPAARAAEPAAAPARSRTAAGHLPPSLGARALLGAVWGALGLCAAAALQMWAAALAGDEAVRPLRQVVTVIEGGQAMVDGSPWIGLAITAGAGAVLGLLFGIAAGRAAPRGLLVAALAFGAGVFAVDHYLLTSGMPVMQLRDEAFLLATRLVFGAVLALGLLPRR